MASSTERNTKPQSFLWLSCLTICLWVGLAAVFNDSQLNDSLEQFIWAQSFEWGYWKHPPLSTWLLFGAIKAFGVNPLWTYALAASLFTVTVIATYKIAEILFNADTAALLALLFTLHYGFTRRAQLYNHNTVLVAFVALTVLVTLWAARDQKTWQWLLVGVLSGLSILVKYQAAVPLVGIIVALGLAQKLRKSAGGIALASVACLLVLAPHIHWLLGANFKTVTYALHYMNEADFGVRGKRQGAFFVNQLRYYLPMVFFIALLWAHRHVRKPGVTEPATPLSAEQKAWVIGLVGFPLATIVFVASAMGVNIQSHWGLQTSQFLPLLVAPWILKKFGQIDLAKISLWALIQAVALAIFVGQGSGLIRHANNGLAVREVPAKKLAMQALAFWSSKSACPLQYISGQSAMSAMISAYSKRDLLVLEEGDPEKSPWIDREAMNSSGYLEVSVSKERLEDANTQSIPYEIQSRKASGTQYLVLKFHAPSRACLQEH